MTRDKIKERILTLIDEISSPQMLDVLNYPIEAVMDEAADLTLRLAPVRAIGMLIDFRNNRVNVEPNGTGRVILPDGFIKLANFKMASWVSDSPVVIDRSSTLYPLQLNQYTRGTPARPVVVIESQELIYYSIASQTEAQIEKAKAVCRIEAGELFPTNLVEPMCWIAASKALTIMREESEAAKAWEQAQIIISNL